MFTLAEELINSIIEGWQKLPTSDGFGYGTMHKGKKVLLVKHEKKWLLSYNGKTYPMPKKASFDHAEKKLAQIS